MEYSETLAPLDITDPGWTQTKHNATQKAENEDQHGPHKITGSELTSSRRIHVH